MTKDTIVAVYPSLFAENKIDLLIENIRKILKIKNLKFGKISRDDFLICVQTDDPVFVSSAIKLLFGIKEIAIVKKIGNDFKTIVTETGKIGSTLLLKGEKFFVKVDGNAKGFVIKDLELAITSELIQKNQKISAKPGSETKHDKLLQVYVTKSNGYVSIFLDEGLGGSVNNSQGQKTVCYISDEFSAVNCLETIKQGFEVSPVICYEAREELIPLVKILDKILPRMLNSEIELHFQKIPKFSKKPIGILTKKLLLTDILIKFARGKKISHISLAISPLIFPSKFIEELQKTVFNAKMMPHISLAGIDSEIMKNAKEIGIEKNLSAIEKLSKKNFSNVKPKKSQSKIPAMKKIKLKLGPNNVHDLLDALEIEH